MSDELILDLFAMAHGGAAIGRDPNGRVVFVPQGIPGERVRARLLQSKEHHAHARLLEVLDASPDRVEARCPHYGVCGGCHLQHVAYPRQLELKNEVVRDQLQRIGRFQDVPVEATLPSPAEWAYRNSVSFSPTEDNRPGFWSPVEEKVIPIQECHIIEPALLTLFQDLDLELPDLRRLTLRVDADENLLVVFETEDVEPPVLEADFPVSAAMVLPTGEAANLFGDNVLLEACAGRRWQVSAGSFFQVNRAAAEHLVALVNELAALEGHESVLELYSGVGLFSAGLAAQAAHLVGIEANPDAVADAAVNLDETDNVELYEGPVEEILPSLSDRAFDVVVLDPPRRGIDPEVVDALLEIRPARIVYVSCDPATLARDARRLGKGGYRLETVRPVDMFPQTFHVECVALMTNIN